MCRVRQLAQWELEAWQAREAAVAAEQEEAAELLDQALELREAQVTAAVLHAVECTVG